MTKALRILHLLCTVVMSLSLTAWAAPMRSTRPVVDEVHSLRVVADGDFTKLPVIDNTANSRIDITFDYLADQEPFLEYRVVHLDAMWCDDDLAELDYLDGFLPVRLKPGRPSFNTHISYYHFSLSFPNPDVRLLVSGNYAVIFYPEGDPDMPVAEATFSVSEQMAFVGGEVTANTDVDFRREHQQLNLQCAWSNARLPHLNPASDLRLVVTQNRRPDTRRDVVSPSRMEASKAYYEHNADLIYEAGNTFRRFEFIDTRFSTLGVERINYHAPYYYVTLFGDASRANSAYSYDQDQHGRYLPRARRVEDVDIEAEYFWAEFRLATAMPPGKGDIYLTGDLTYGEYTDAYRMQYDEELQCYTCSLLLKQGNYNYQYVSGWPAYDAEGNPDNAGRFSLARTEGNYYETKNQYDIYVYYRPAGARYDRLLGIATLMP